jgi:hypothetical protein
MDSLTPNTHSLGRASMKQVACGAPEAPDRARNYAADGTNRARSSRGPGSGRARSWGERTQRFGEGHYPVAKLWDCNRSSGR